MALIRRRANCNFPLQDLDLNQIGAWLPKPALGHYGCNHQICRWLLVRCSGVLGGISVFGQTHEDPAAIPT
jgi:hypothetical protein